jgi:hypothetical protein
MPMKRLAILTAALVAATVASPGAQENPYSAAPEPALRPGWIFTPSIGVAETYDDNITLFGNLEPLDNSDLVSSVGPSGTISYFGKHSRFTGGYGASFLNYRTFSVFDRWNQHGEASFRRQESAQFEWYANGSGQAVPSTDALFYNGVPFVHTGAVTFDARGGVNYKLDARNTITSALQYQHVDFNAQTDIYQRYLRGGWAASSINTYRRRVDERLSVGADYQFERSRVRLDIDTANAHTMEGAVDYQLSSRWKFSGAAGVAILTANIAAVSQTAPAFRASLEEGERGQHFHVGYMQGILPSFGLGGTMHTKELSVGFFTPLFHSRRFYTDNSAVYRDNTPVLRQIDPLELRSLQTFSTFGWMASRWVRVEGFYTHLSQSSLVAGGRLDRNRIGIQIVTSKPMRID